MGTVGNGRGGTSFLILCLGLGSGALFTAGTSFAFPFAFCFSVRAAGRLGPCWAFATGGPAFDAIELCKSFCTAGGWDLELVATGALDGTFSGLDRLPPSDSSKLALRFLDTFIEEGSERR